MNVTWEGGGDETPVRISAAGWLRVGLRALALSTILLAGVIVKLLLRLIEYPIFREKRPITPWVTRTVCRQALWVIGLRLRVIGRPMKMRGAWVANHASWLDIFVLNAVKSIYFVSKAEVAGWPGIGFLAKITGTVFIARDPRQAKAQTALFVERLRAFCLLKQLSFSRSLPKSCVARWPFSRSVWSIMRRRAKTQDFMAGGAI